MKKRHILGAAAAAFVTSADVIANTKKRYILAGVAATYLTGAGVTAKVAPLVMPSFEQASTDDFGWDSKRDSAEQCYVVTYNYNNRYNYNNEPYNITTENDAGFCQKFEGGAYYAAINGTRNAMNFVCSNFWTSALGIASMVALCRLAKNLTKRPSVRQRARDFLAPEKPSQKPVVDLMKIINGG